MALSQSFYWKAGSVLGASAIVFGAFGAHVIKKYVGNDPKKLQNWSTAAHYQLIHAIALIALSSIPRTVRPINPYAAPLILGGTTLFSGSIYLLTLKETFKFLSPITPVGGLTMIAGWLALLL